MKFLVILAALLINHYWTRDRVLPGDSWFDRLQAFLLSQSLRFESANAKQVLTVVGLLLPSCILLILLWLFEGVWFGFASFCIHAALLLALFDPLHLRTWAQRYLTHWRQGDFEGAYLTLQERHPKLGLENSDDQEAVHILCTRFLLNNSFERLFAILFWYLVLGPAGALTYFSLVQMRGLGCRDQSVDFEQAWLKRLEFVLEWVPARLLGLTFALAGQFEPTFSCLRRYVVEAGGTAREVIFVCANAAMGRIQKTMLVHNSEDGGALNTLVIDMEGDGEQLSTEQYAQQIEDVLGLMDRSQIIWVSALALLAVYGIGG